MTGRAGRQGSVLLIVLLGLLLIEAMVLGSLAIAANGATAARIAEQRLHARLTAESAVREGLADWTDRDWDDLAVGTTDRRPGTRVDGGHIEIEALGNGRFLIRGRAARIDRILAQALVHIMPRDSLRALFDAALHVHGAIDITGASSIDGSGTDALAHCEVTPVPGVVAPPLATTLEAGAVLHGAPPLREATEDPVHAIAGLALHDLHPLADLVATETLPADALCPEQHCLVFAPGNLTLSGGAGQGMLVVLGRLRLVSDATFTGAVLAGALDLANGHIRGAARTFGTDTTRIDGTLRFDPCAVEGALSATGLGRPFRRGARLWLPAR